MRKFIFTLMLVALGSAWSVSSAICMASFPNQSGETEWFAGILEMVSYPCEEGEDCPDCMTVALKNASDQTTYYLTGLDEEVQEWAESMEYFWQWSITVAGVPFMRGSYEFIQVDQIWMRCMTDISTCLDKPSVVIRGTLRPFRCSYEDALIPLREYETCETVVLENDKGVYPLTWQWSEKDLQILLDTLQNPLPVIVSGQQDCGSIIVHNISIDTSRPITSLCDTWNVFHEPFMGLPGEYYLRSYNLTADTIISTKRYVKLEAQYQGSVHYEGALREGDNHDIYIVPKGRTQEFLLYAFNAQVGDQLTNLWLGCDYCSEAIGYSGNVTEIVDSNPRVFTVTVEYDDQETLSHYSYPIRWIDGVGFASVPNGDKCPADCPADFGIFNLLCAYKNGEQVYASEEANQFGCWYESSEQQGDTVKLYVQDGPGSSTVNPVDPNELVATVKGDQLIIREFMDKEITYDLRLSFPNSAPARSSGTVQSDTFRESVSIQLTESGSYVLRLTNPDWNYSIVGTFDFIMTALPTVDIDVPVAQKILRDGQMLIKQGERLYSPTGIQIE